MKKSKLKEIVKMSCKVTSFQYLLKEIKDKDMTKMKNVKYEKLEMQNYLKCEKINLKKKKILFKSRTRMLKVNHNFGNKSPCPLCELNDDEQSHLLECVIIKVKCPEIFENRKNCKYEDIFSNDLKKRMILQNC